MGNKTFVPAFRCKVGDWDYFVCTMKYAEVSKQVGFAFERGGNMELGKLVQRGLSERTKDITKYLLESEHRFLGALVVAVWGGEPIYTPLHMVDPDGMLSGVDQGFGVLTFDGTQSYYALDGQHRLKAIKDAVIREPDLGKEDICVLMVTAYDTEKGRIRTRRLFTNINRNAKKTDQAENIALDEDDSFAIVTRRLLEEHPFLKREGIVNVIKSYNENTGALKLYGNNVAKGDKTALTTFAVLYDLLQYLAYDMPGTIRNKTTRPADDALDKAYKTFSDRLDDLLQSCGNVRDKMENAVSAVEVRAPKNAEQNGHAFMRPIVQKSVCRVIGILVQQGYADWETLMQRLSELDWRIGMTPWEAVFNLNNKRMETGTYNVEVLDALLSAHLAPQNKASIDRALKEFKNLKNQAYPVSKEELYKRVPTGDTLRPVVAHTTAEDIKEISDVSEIPIFTPPADDNGEEAETADENEE